VTNRDEFHQALADAPQRDLSAEFIAGLPSHPDGIVAALRRVESRVEHRAGPEFMAAVHLNTLDTLTDGTLG
jgi:hypothetical protein